MHTSSNASKTHNLKLYMLYPYQLHKEILINENLLIIDAMLHQGIISRQITTPPNDAKTSDKYVIPDNATGEWQNKKNQIAIKLLDKWHYIPPNNGMTIWVLDEKRQAVYLDAMWQQISN